MQKNLYLPVKCTGAQGSRSTTTKLIVAVRGGRLGYALKPPFFVSRAERPWPPA